MKELRTRVGFVAYEILQLISQKINNVNIEIDKAFPQFSKVNFYQKILFK